MLDKNNFNYLTYSAQRRREWSSVANLRATFMSNRGYIGAIEVWKHDGNKSYNYVGMVDCMIIPKENHLIDGFIKDFLGALDA